MESAERLETLALAARAEFMANGFVRTRMSDVASRAEVSQGLLYTYFESKDALIHYVIEREIAGKPLPLDNLPMSDPGPDAAGDLLGHALARVFGNPSLGDAVSNPTFSRTELEAIIRGIYHGVSRWRNLLAMIERTARDRAPLRERYYRGGRRPFLGHFSDYIEQGITAGAFRPVTDASVAARLIVETVAWFAHHRFGDQDSADIDDFAAEETVVEMLLAAVMQP